MATVVAPVTATPVAWNVFDNVVLAIGVDQIKFILKEAFAAVLNAGLICKDEDAAVATPT